MDSKTKESLKFIGKEVKQLAKQTAYKDEYGVKIIHLEELLYRIDSVFGLEETA
jgi:hypothetical protein